MEKEYVTVRLFKNHRSAEGMNTDQQQTTESQNDSQENSETSESDGNQNESFLPRRVQRAVQRASELLGLNSKES